MIKRIIVCLISFFSIALGYCQSPKKIAYVIAVSEYKTLDTKNLNNNWRKIGSSNDSEIIRKTLRQRGFTYIINTQNQDATIENIRDEFEDLISESNKGDIVFIHISAHGQQIKDSNKDETDGLDEAIVLYDSPKTNNNSYKGERHLIDDELDTFITRLRKKIGNKGQVILSIDACHSGTAYKGTKEDIRGGEPPIIFDGDVIKTNNISDSYLDNQSNSNPKGNEDAHFIFLSSTNSIGLSKQKNFDGKVYGAYSYFLNKALNNSRNVTYSDLINEINKSLEDNRIGQKSVLEWCGSCKLFSGNSKGEDEELQFLDNAGLNSYAICIGVSKYKEQNSLRFAHFDAIKFNEFITSQSILTKRKLNSSLYLSLPEGSEYNEIFTDANNSNIVFERIREIRTQINPGDLFYFFFSGHGVYSEKEQGILLLSDAENFGDKTEQNYLSLKRINNELDQIVRKGAKIIFVVDACRAGGSSSKDGNRNLGLDLMNMKWDNQISLFSCNPGQYSYESNLEYAGVFSLYLMKGLLGAADEGNLQVDKEEIEKYLKEKIAQEISCQIPSVTCQIPLIIGKPDFILSKVDPATQFILKDDFTRILNKSINDEVKNFLNSQPNREEKNKIFELFIDRLSSYQLLEPEDNNALYYWNKMNDFTDSKGIYELCRKQLLKSLKEDARILLKRHPESNILGDKVNSKEYEKKENINESKVFRYLKAAELIALNSEKNEIKALTLACEVNNEIPNVLKITQITKYETEKILDPLVKKTLKSLELDSTISTNYFQLGFLYTYLQDFRNAENAYLKYISKVRNDSRAFFNLGYLYEEYFDNREFATKYYKLSIDADSLFGKPYARLGNLVISSEERTTLLKKAIKLDSSNYNAFYFLSNQYLSLYNNSYGSSRFADSAYNILEKTDKLFPTETGRYFYWANYFEKTGDEQEAIKFYKLTEQNCIRYRNKSIESLRDLFVDQDNYEEALKYHKKYYPGSSFEEKLIWKYQYIELKRAIKIVKKQKK